MHKSRNHRNTRYVTPRTCTCTCTWHDHVIGTCSILAAAVMAVHAVFVSGSVVSVCFCRQPFSAVHCCSVSFCSFYSSRSVAPFVCFLSLANASASASAWFGAACVRSPFHVHVGVTCHSLAPLHSGDSQWSASVACVAAYGRQERAWETYC